MSQSNPGISERRDGWLGEPCKKCEGYGEIDNPDGNIVTCSSCGGTGEAYDINQDDRAGEPFPEDVNPEADAFSGGELGREAKEEGDDFLNEAEGKDRHQ